MRRLLQFESDAKFFDTFTEAFVKSFYAHNRGWDLYVADLGLTPGQRKQLEQYGTVKQYPVDPCRRWTNLTARIYSLYDILQSDTLVMRADVDGIVCRSYEPLVKEFVDGDYGAFGMQLPYPLTRRSRHVAKAAELLGVPIDSAPIQDNAISAAFMLLRGKPLVLKSFEWLRQNWEQYFVYIKEEEPAIASVFYKYGVKYKCIGWEYYHPTGMAADAMNYTIPADRPYSCWCNGPAYGMHFAVGKFYLLNSAVWAQNDMFRAWQSVLIEPYRNLAWPKPEDVRDRS